MTRVLFSKAVMHRVPTYEELIQDTILHPIDKIKLPDRQATFLRNSPQLTRFDELDDPAIIEAEEAKITRARMQQLMAGGVIPPAAPSTAAAAAAAASLHATAAAVAAVDVKPRRRIVIGKQKPQPGDPLPPTPTQPAVVQKPRRRIVIGKQKPQPGDPLPPPPPTQPAVVQKPRRRIVIGKQKPQPGDPISPQPENTSEEERESLKIPIQAPSKVKMPELFSLIEKALQHNAVDEEMTTAFRKIKAQIVDGNYDELSKAEHKELKHIYKTTVWDRAKRRRGAGRFAPIY
jgi:hypothetical protein